MLHIRHVINCRTIYHVVGLFVFIILLMPNEHRISQKELNGTLQRMSAEGSSCTSEGKKETGWGQGEKQRHIKAAYCQRTARHWEVCGSESSKKVRHHICLFWHWNWPTKQPKNSLKVTKMDLNDRCKKVASFSWKFWIIIKGEKIVSLFKIHLHSTCIYLRAYYF